MTELAKELDDFVTLLRASDDRAPVFYVTPEFNDAYMKGNESTYPDHALWLRNIYGEPSASDMRELDLLAICGAGAG